MCTMYKTVLDQPTVGLAVADEMPASEMFTVTGVNTENALPLVTVEIGRLLHYSV